MQNKLSKIRQLFPEFLNAAGYAVTRGRLAEYLSLILQLVMTRIRRGQQLPDYLENSLPKRRENQAYIVNNASCDIGINCSLIARLPGVDLEIGSTIDWDFTTDDQEDGFALHRFGWLLRNYAAGEVDGDVVEAVICDWINRVPCQVGTIGWDSYSISERLVNWILLLEDTQTKHGEVIRQSVSIQAWYLLSGLEYRGEDTNNHLINNARALYIAGYFLGDEELMDVARAILGRESQRMFSESGFLREGSSHYQLLLARTFMEVVWYARKLNDHVLLDVIESKTKNIWHAASFFLQDRPFPIFGDLSPDFVPEFHFGVGCVGGMLFGEQPVGCKEDGVGWHTIFAGADSSVVYGDITDTRGLTSYSDAGYYRFSNDSYTLYIYVNPIGYVPGWSHGHADIGNFILYWKEHPVFIGTGRSSYRESPASRYGRSVCSHNAVAIDGREPCVVHGLNGVPDAMSKDYLQPPPRVEVVTENGVLKIAITYAGMARWINGCEMRREFECWPSELVINDTINGAGRHGIDTYFQIADECQPEAAGSHLMLQQKDVSLCMDYKQGMKMEIVKGREGQAPLGWSSNRYGDLHPINSLVFSQIDGLPIHNRYRISERLIKST